VEKSFLSVLGRKVLVFDGAMGTNLQVQNLTSDDFGGERYNGCNEYLVRTCPGAVEKVHAGFLQAGADVIETDTFGGAGIVLAEYGLADQAYQLNLEAAKLAKRVAADFSGSGQPRFVAGSIGPTTKLPSLGHIGFTEMEESFRVQAKGLLDGGVDLLVVETCQDLLQSKAALAGVFDCFAESKKRVPIIVSVTIEATGTMLLGTEIAAALTALRAFDVDVIGMNCATGPKEMSENVRHLCLNSPKPVFIMPNAGIPENVGGHAHYHLSPDELVYYLSHFVRDLGVQVVGGCCGTTPAHIKKLAEAVGSLEPVPRKWESTSSCSSLYQSVPFHVDPAPVLIGERTNANGSKLFRDLLAKEDWEGLVAMGKEQVREGAHVLDLCTAFVGRDEVRDMRELVTRFNTQVTAPLMIDSTEAPAIEEALRRIGGKAIVNSINLEDGEERMQKILPLCRKYGAAVVALTIDEQGMAKTAERKVEIARRILDLAVNKYGMKEEDIIFDTLTFTLASGEEEFRGSAVATIEAIRTIKKEHPSVHTSLGVSNISFGLSPQSRHALNSVFLHHAIEYGLDMAIVHASKIMPLFKIPADVKEICRRLVFNERSDGSDPLVELLAYYKGRKEEKTQVASPAATVEERLKQRIIDGNKVDLSKDLDEGRKKYTPLEIINTILLDGMKVVGELFGSGQMQLPFVLQSAEVMKSSVGYLEQFMDKADTTSKGTMVIATVKGDVHDIGKNLVDIILTNNGYKVVNLGIQCPLDRMLTACEEHRADALGMSGLLVKSTLIMKENLAVMTERGLNLPVILGGAALTRRYVEQDLRRVYSGPLAYANDAFDGLRFMEELPKHVAATRADTVQTEEGEPPATVPAADDTDFLSGIEAKMAIAPKRMPEKAPARAPIPKVPWYGTRVVGDIDLDGIFPYINETALIRGQWQVRKGKMGEEAYAAILKEQVLPELEALKKDVKRRRLLVPKVIYGYFPCQSEGNDLVIYRPIDGRDPRGEWSLPAENWNKSVKEWVRFSFPRQAKDRHICLADFFAPAGSPEPDVVAFQVVTMGHDASAHSQKLFTSNNYKDYLYFHGLSVETAEALAELWHKNVRKELNIGAKDSPEIKKLFSQQYQGSRYSFGYPACPSLEDQKLLFELLDPARIGVELTEEFQLVPEQSTTALIVHHPEAKYFNV
jgi:5-methyltetrahydrofolate--homocysteine methyltransferase